MERRVLLAILLCFISLYLWQVLVVKPVPRQVAGGRPPGPASPGKSSAAPASSAPSPAPAPAPPAVVLGDTVERAIRIESADVIAEFTNRGGRLRSWRLKHYFDQNRQPQELVVAVPNQPLPFTLETADAAATRSMNEALYRVEGGSATIAPPSGPAKVTFELRDSTGLHVTKTFRIDPSGYVIGFEGRVARTAGDTSQEAPVEFAIAWGPAVGDVGEVSRYVRQAGGLFYTQDGSVVRKTAKDFAAQPTFEGDFKYAGVEDNYFLAVALSPGPSRITYQPVAVPPAPGSQQAARTLVAYTITPRSSEPLRFFAGPKDFDVLAAIGPELTYAIDFGRFRVIVVPLLRSLKWINGYVGNYGWSIIILTILINAIMFPLRHKANVSMRKMQELQPEVKAIQDRYAKLKATDPAKQKMNQELMQLYRERGVNPAGGCIPMLLTMPVLYALYALLSTAIELRGAPFIGWIHDLSAHDPLYITPIVMGGTMVWQQHLAPAGADPAQQRMMMLMPIIFTFMFLWAPAGVSIYWLASNLLGIGQQYLTNYLIGPPNVRTLRPAAERRVKRAGGGKNAV